MSRFLHGTWPTLPHPRGTPVFTVWFHIRPLRTILDQQLKTRKLRTGLEVGVRRIISYEAINV
ncbi:MAG: hypothetical protein VX605_09165, partial [Pseudomonadota bacterium]|nr:hypothetical protein [Pseudomonadota bacterium]